jgi:hypothetical protein
MNILIPNYINLSIRSLIRLLIFALLFLFQDVRKKGSASKLIFINNNLDDRQKEAIQRVVLAAS